MMPRLPKPEPVIVSTVCSECGLPWDDHGEAPTLADCVRLLKARPVLSPTITTWNGYPTNVTSSGATITNLYVASSDDPPDDAVPAAV